MAKKKIDYDALRRSNLEKQKRKKKKNTIIAISGVVAMVVIIVASIIVANVVKNIKDQKRREALYPRLDNITVENVNSAVDLLESRDFTQTEEVTDYIIINVKNYGEIVCQLREDIAPITVANIKKLVSEKFYDGLIFHRVIEGFMIQGGGVTQSYTEKESPSIKGEFESNGVKNDLLHYRGVLSMARTSVKDSASSQFFIMHETSPHLDGDYAAFGYVIAGMEVVDAIATTRTNANDMPVEDVVIESIRFATKK